MTLAATALVATTAAAEPPPTPATPSGRLTAEKSLRTGFIDLNGYYDSRQATGLTVNLLANLPASLQYFSLTNFVNLGGAMSLRDQETFYTEQNLRWSPQPPLPVALTTQWVVRAGEQNDALRAGVLWKVSKTPVISSALATVGLSYHVNLHAFQFDFIEEVGWRGQVEHVYKLRPLSGALGARFYLAGFMDHNLWLGGPAGTETSRIVTEHQLGARLIGGLHVVTELRYNQFLADQRLGIGVGLQYFLPFQLKP